MGTGGGDKHRFTVQLSVAKDDIKLLPRASFKGASFNGTRENRSGAVVCELKNRLSDRNRNECPPEEEFLTCNETGGSDRCLTIDIFDRVIFTSMKVQEGNRGAILLEDFKSHSTPEAKEHVKSFKSRVTEEDDEDMHKLVDPHMIAGGITTNG